MQTVKKKFITLTMRSRALVMIALAIVIAGSSAVVVHADRFDEQINALNAQNDQNRAALGDLRDQAASYQDQIARLQAQINALQAAIAENQARQAELQRNIEAAQREMDIKKGQLSENIKAMYVDGQMSSVEMFASSNSLSEYVDKEEYLSAVQGQLNKIIEEINALQARLQREKTELETLAASLRAQNEQLSATRSELNSMLAYNAGQQAAYNNQISANSAKIAELRRQQAIENARYNVGAFRGDPSNGGYPNKWHNAPMDSIVDTWGMYNRQCVSFTAWKVHQDFLAGKNKWDMPYWGGRGNANQWDDNARRAGIPVTSTPKVGSIAVSNSGYYGHVMYVEAVRGNQIYISQYNAGWTGQYSEGWRTVDGLVFIHFMGD